jgi:hypothetical protein
MIRLEPIRLEVTTQLLLRDSWMKEIERGLMKLNTALLELGLQPAHYAHVLYIKKQEMVHVYPKHYRSQTYYTDAMPTAIKGAFNRQFYPSDAASKLDEFLLKEFGVPNDDG